jgi:tripartite-type tricarboxylate transporter receptor subunit TctC
VVDKLHDTLIKTLRDATVVERLAGGGAEVITSDPEQCASFMKTQLQFWGPIIKRVGVSAG